MTRPAILLLSGGLDSATCAAIAKEQGFSVHGLSFRYGQRHSAELEAAARVAKTMGLAEHKIADIDLRLFGGSALTDDSLKVPDAGAQKGIPTTYVPARNTIFLSFALAYAEVVGAFDIFIGVNAVDYSGYPDCRPSFIDAFQKLANVATAASTDGSSQFKQGRFTIHAPLINITKAQIIKQGHALGVDYSQTVSCYQANMDGQACGECDSCYLRKKGFDDAGIADPTRYMRD